MNKNTANRTKKTKLDRTRFASVPEAPYIAAYGACPICGSNAVSRERSPGGNTTCASGHKYPSRESIYS